MDKPPIPPDFLARMQAMLGDAYADFTNIYSRHANSGLRVNLLKITVDDFIDITPFPLTSIPWCPSGFIFPSEDLPGKHPFHAAGLYYLQDPSAMAVAEVLSPQPEELILDLAAAPGGKSTHIAALMGNSGTLVANEMHPNRVWDLARNLERCGVRNAIVLNETPRMLADQFGDIFDRVLLDAPCSGEGMFRKSESARRDWSVKLVRSCAFRQIEILKDAAKLVRPGGFLAYATCTFAPEENEEVVDHFLQDNPQFQLVKPVNFIGSSTGFQNPNLIYSDPDLIQKVIRLWPHTSVGEGHFIALLQRTDLHPQRKIRSWKPKTLNDNQNDAVINFTNNVLNNDSSILDSIKSQQLTIHGTYVYVVPDRIPDLNALRIIHSGWWIGTLKENRFTPSHALAMGLVWGDFHYTFDVKPDNEILSSYMRGESIHVERSNGWTVFSINRYPLGWLNCKDGLGKNYLPKGLRWNI